MELCSLCKTTGGAILCFALSWVTISPLGCSDVVSLTEQQHGGAETVRQIDSYENDKISSDHCLPQPTLLPGSGPWSPGGAYIYRYP